jgi:multiple sugar transport system permease protein
MSSPNPTQAATLAVDSAPLKKQVGLESQERTWGLIFLSPWIIGFLIFTLIPILVSLYFTFTDFKLNGDKSTPVTFVGLANWQKVFTDPDTMTALGVTLKFAAISLPVTLVIPILMAALLNSKHLKLRRIWTTLFYMPYIVPAVSVAFIWRSYMNSDSGWLNRFLRLIGIANPPSYLQDPNWVLIAFLLVGLWGVGNAMLITLAGMQGVPTELYEAAQVDGASGWTQFTRITIPMISPVIFYNLVLTVIALMQYFTIPYIMTGAGINSNPGDPNKAALFLNLYLYKTAFSYFDMGYGATLAWVIFIMGLAVTALLFATAPFWVYYASGE